MIKLLPFVAFLVFFSSCTMVLVEEIDGGHSPMMILNGHWRVVEDVRVDNDGAVVVGSIDSVWFNAKKDVGGYCEGTWYESETEAPIFYWQINRRATAFTTKQDDKLTDWEVIEQEKKSFIIEATVNGQTQRLKMEKVWEED